MIQVDASKCLGCFSCSNVCPSQNITRLETSEKRSIHWKKCKEECDLCVEFCPAKALALVPFDEASEEPTVAFMRLRLRAESPCPCQKSRRGPSGRYLDT
jgi:Fe-S-cluster-containing hydrogenase component 2